MSLTADEAEAYLKRSDHCPYCGSWQTEGKSVDFPQIGWVEQERSCNVCEKRWIDSYELITITEFKEEG